MVARPDLGHLVRFSTRENAASSRPAKRGFVTYCDLFRSRRPDNTGCPARVSVVRNARSAQATMLTLRRLALAIVVVAGCRSASSDPIIIEEPVERPLPPASGTPIGILLDERVKLELRADQIEKLHEIDERLATRNAQLDSELRELDRPPELPAGSQGGPGMRGRGGGGGGGMGGPPMGGGGGGPRGGGGPGGKGPRGGRPPGGHGDPGTRGRLLEERSTNVRDAITRALDILDSPQRSVAMQILDEHGAADPTRLPPPPGGMRAPDGERSMQHRGRPPGPSPSPDGASQADP